MVKSDVIGPGVKPALSLWEASSESGSPALNQTLNLFWDIFGTLPKMDRQIYSNDHSLLICPDDMFALGKKKDFFLTVTLRVESKIKIQ